MGTDSVERIWRREDLKVPQKPHGRLWFNDGSCVQLRPMHRNHVWSYDFVSARTHDGRIARALNLIDEHTREALVFRVGRHWSSAKVIRVLAEPWRKHYNTARPHSSLDYQPPAPEAWMASTVRLQEEPVASLPAPLATMSCINLNSEIDALH